MLSKAGWGIVRGIGTAGGCCCSPQLGRWLFPVSAKARDAIGVIFLKALRESRSITPRSCSLAAGAFFRHGRSEPWLVSAASIYGLLEHVSEHLVDHVAAGTATSFRIHRQGPVKVACRRQAFGDADPFSFEGSRS